jgi:hypothetical protein
LQWPTTELGPPDAIDDSSHKNLEKGRTMKNVLATLLTAGAITAAALGLTTTANPGRPILRRCHHQPAA